MKKKTSQKLISFLIIIAILIPAVLFSRPKQAEAQTALGGPSWLVDIFTGGTLGASGVSAGQETIQTGFKIKEFAKDILKQIIMTVQKRLLAEMTKSTINWINTGFHGSPLFVENPKSFFTDIVKSEVKTIVDQIGYDVLHQPFGKQMALNIINSYKSTLQSNSEYTLSRVINDPRLLQNYRTDFNVGGWNGFFINNLYPQNNYLGYNMIIRESLGRKVDNPINNEIKKVQDTLQKGMGFLSPETCPGNSANSQAYNKVIGNAWQRPSFKTPAMSDSEKNALNACYNNSIGAESEAEACVQRVHDQYNTRVGAAKATWANTNTCKAGLVTTTPGSVVASQITNAMGSNFRQTELGAALGNSMSAIFDALLTKFLGDGLNALASKVNPEPEPDTWDYDGHTLGGPGDNNRDPFSGPDEVVDLGDFKETVDRGIENTNMELELIFNDITALIDPGTGKILNNPGIMQILGLIWPATRELDICLPGPDLGWQARTLKELERNSGKLNQKSTDDDPKEAATARLVLRELQFAVDFFEDWINNKMMIELPNAILYMDAVDALETLYQQSDELVAQKRAKASALARLQAIKSGLDDFTTQPEPNSGGEKVLINLKKQYNAISATVSNTASLDDTRNDLSIAKEKFEKLKQLTKQCTAERTKKGWANPGGQSSLNNSGTERQLFCDYPVSGGYTHESFIGPDSTRPKLPMVNGKKVFKFDKAFGSGTTDIAMDCNFIYKANVLDYKGTIPGLTTAVDSSPASPLGTCSYLNYEDEPRVDESVTESACLDRGGTWGGVGSSTTTTTTTPPGTPPPPPPTIIGSCGTSNGQIFSSGSLTTNLCSTGTPSSLFGSGPWTWNCNGSGVGGYGATCSANLAQVVTPPPPPTAGQVALSASSSIGPSFSMGSVTLTATNPDSGQFYYYFFCNRSQTDSPPPVPNGFINSPLLISESTYVSPVKCSYPTAGTYRPKVISLKLGNPLIWRQGWATITVQ